MDIIPGWVMKIAIILVAIILCKLLADGFPQGTRKSNWDKLLVHTHTKSTNVQNDPLSYQTCFVA